MLAQAHGTRMGADWREKCPKHGLPVLVGLRLNLPSVFDGAAHVLCGGVVAAVVGIMVPILRAKTAISKTQRNVVPEPPLMPSVVENSSLCCPERSRAGMQSSHRARSDSLSIILRALGASLAIRS